ncbi:MAG: type II toxin-antitoxin system RelE/ParE family toxin [Candidatus Desantisbacteria bacterium]
MIYKVETANRNVEKEILKLPSSDRNRVAKKILELENEPRPPGVVKLKNNIYRLRVGGLRVIYEVSDRERLVVVTKVARRKETTYKRI